MSDCIHVGHPLTKSNNAENRAMHVNNNNNVNTKPIKKCVPTKAQPCSAALIIVYRVCLDPRFLRGTTSFSGRSKGVKTNTGSACSRSTWTGLPVHPTTAAWCGLLMWDLPQDGTVARASTANSRAAAQAVCAAVVSAAAVCREVSSRRIHHRVMHVWLLLTSEASEAHSHPDQ